MLLLGLALRALDFTGRGSSSLTRRSPPFVQSPSPGLAVGDTCGRVGEPVDFALPLPDCCVGAVAAVANEEAAALPEGADEFSLPSPARGTVREREAGYGVTPAMPAVSVVLSLGAGAARPRSRIASA